jgi:hypothetical protein
MSQWKDKQEKRRKEIREECDRRGLRILPYGELWRIEGLGVDILTTDLAALTVTELDRVLIR